MALRNGTVLCRFLVLVLAGAVLFSGSRLATAEERIQLTVDPSEAQAALAILKDRREGKPVDEAAWHQRGCGAAGFAASGTGLKSARGGVAAATQLMSLPSSSCLMSPWRFLRFPSSGAWGSASRASSRAFFLSPMAA
jgi:hypothetical protein